MFHKFSSVFREQLTCHNVYEKEVRTIHKAKVSTSFQRPEQGCVLYTGASYTREITVYGFVPQLQLLLYPIIEKCTHLIVDNIFKT